MARSSAKRVVDIEDFAQINRYEPTRSCCNAHACSSTPSALDMRWAAEHEASTGCIRALRFSAHDNDMPPEIVHCRSIFRHQSFQQSSRQTFRYLDHCAFLVAISGTVQLLTSHHHLLTLAPTDCP
jgi:hypothetical protein